MKLSIQLRVYGKDFKSCKDEIKKMPFKMFENSNMARVDIDNRLYTPQEISADDFKQVETA
jgi:hypothetical protein